MRKKIHFSSFLQYFLLALFYLFIFLYCFAFNNPVGWFLLYFITCLFIFGIFSISFPLSKIKIKEHEKLFFTAGEKEILQIAVKHTNQKKIFLPNVLFSVLLEKNMKEGILGSTQFLFTSEEKVFFETIFEQRGVYKNPQVLVTSKDLLGIFQKKRELVFFATLYIVPVNLKEKMEPIFALLCQEKLLDSYESSNKNFDIKSFRDFRSGDTMKMIDWKLSAKNRSMIVKEFEKDTQTETIALFFGEEHSFFEYTLAIYHSLSESFYTMHIERAVLASSFISESALNSECFASLQAFTSPPEINPQLYKNKTVFLFAPVYSKACQQFIQKIAVQSKIILIIPKSESVITIQKNNEIQEIEV